MQALVGVRTIVELRDDVAIKGVLVDVDDRMNCVLENAVRRTPEGSTMKLERVYVNARTIRFVHVPKDVDPSELIERKRLERFEANGITSGSPRSDRGTRRSRSAGAPLGRTTRPQDSVERVGIWARRLP